MKFLSFQTYLKIFTSLTNAIFLLGLIALLSSIGSIIEQDENLAFYQENYPSLKPIYGFIDWKFILYFGFDHIYTSWWFLLLLFLLSICLISCSITRQFPIVKVGKDYIFKQKTISFQELPFFIRFKNLSYSKENFLIKIQKMNFYIYQKKNIIYGYKGLIGRISPILVHVSLLIILFGSSISAFFNFKAQEIVPKGELFHIQNSIKLGSLTTLPSLSARINDFWVEYESNRVHQFYSNLSILNDVGTEIQQQTISVNNPLRYNNIDFYQSDWNLIGIRVKNELNNKIYEFPLFPFQKDKKQWITWIITKNFAPNSNSFSEIGQNFTLIIQQLENTILIYNEKGILLSTKNIGEYLTPNLRIIEILPSTGLLIKYDPTIPIIYFGFGLLMITALLSYLPYTQIWMVKKTQYSLLGSTTNRGKIQLEIDFENLIRSFEKKILQSEKL